MAAAYTISLSFALVYGYVAAHNRAAERVMQTGKMLQLEPMPALERRWVHLALRDHLAVGTQSIGEEPNRRVVVVPKAVV